jgi:glycosyltransferase involved in cell wall biosynthesis
VVLPVYNAEASLATCLDALMVQSCAELEIVAVDDGSTDSSAAILAEYAQRDPERMRVITCENGGTWRARRIGVQAAHGSFIGFCDSDDLPAPALYETLRARAMAAEADLVVCAYERVDARDGRLLATEMTRFGMTSVLVEDDLGLLPLINTALWNKLFRAELLRQVPDLDSVPRVGEDMIELLMLYPLCRKIAFVDTPLYRYRVQATSSMATVRFDDLVELRASLLQARRFLRELMPDGRFLSVCDLMALAHLGLSLPLRLAPATSPDASGAPASLRAGVAFAKHSLDEDFPLYKGNALCSLRANLAHRGRALPLMLAAWCYRLNLPLPLLTAARRLTFHPPTW